MVRYNFRMYAHVSVNFILKMSKTYVLSMSSEVALLNLLFNAVFYYVVEDN